MEILHQIRHLDDTIGDMILRFGPWSYAILFLIVGMIFIIDIGSEALRHRLIGLGADK